MKTIKFCRSCSLIASLLFHVSCFDTSIADDADVDKTVEQVYAQPQLKRETLPTTLPEWNDDEKAILNGAETTIIPEVQNHIRNYIERRRNPVSAAILVSVKTGEILALVQGKPPETWGADSHTALHTAFPAASLFKTIVSASAIEVIDFDSHKKLNLLSGCGEVNAQGVWMRNDAKGRRFKINLRRAYGSSCNDFFAKLAINEIGLGPILHMARRFGWNNQPIPADFLVPSSPMREPNPNSSSVHTIGRFAAGFGYVGLSVAHAAWQMLAIANNGQSKPLQLFKSQEPLEGHSPHQSDSNHLVITSEHTARKLRKLMDATVLGGTASSAFRRGKYRRLRFDVGGKTGTLTGSFPDGITTWFAGMYPLDEPEVVVATVTVLEKLWHFKAPNLAAEALYSYKSWEKKHKTIANRKTKILPNQHTNRSKN